MEHMYEFERTGLDHVCHSTTRSISILWTTYMYLHVLYMYLTPGLGPHSSFGWAYVASSAVVFFMYLIQVPNIAILKYM